MKSNYNFNIPSHMPNKHFYFSKHHFSKNSSIRNFFSISPGENKLLELVRTFLFQKHPVPSNMTSASEYEVAPRSFTQSFWRMSLSTNSTKLFSSCGIWVRSPFHPPIKLLCFNHSSFLEGKEIVRILRFCSSVSWNYVYSAVHFCLGCNQLLRMEQCSKGSSPTF